MDPEILANLPRFAFQSQNAGDGLQCSICQYEYVENDSALRLPNCKHIFHEDCITPWLKGHSHCPLCRYNVEPALNVSGTAPEQQVLEARREQQVLESEAEHVLECEPKGQVFQSAGTEQNSAQISEAIIPGGIHNHLNCEQG